METTMVAVQDLNPGDAVYYANYKTIVEEVEVKPTMVWIWLRVINNGAPYTTLVCEPYGRKVERVIA